MNDVFQQQDVLFPGPSDESSPQESWSKVMARRMESLVMSFPVHQVSSKGESGYYPEWRDQNFAFLALQVFDSVFARMAPGLGRGATREEIVLDLSPHILARQPDLTEAQVEHMVDFILNHLMNEGKGSFEQECVWLDEEENSRPYAFRYALLKSYHDPLRDRFIIRATRESIHLFLRMLDQPIQDEQITNLFVLQEQVRRGRIGRSRREAERTMLLSLEYERYIEDMLRAIRRDVRSVDWVREVTPKIEEAHQHVQRLIRDQGQVLRELKGELQQTHDHSRLMAIHELIHVLETCQGRHMELQRRILEAGPSFLEEQAYQRFRSMARSPMPDLNEQVFLPALSVEEPFFEDILDLIYADVLGPRLPRIFDLEVFVDRLLRDDFSAAPVMSEEDQEDRLPVHMVFDPLELDIEEKIAKIVNQVGSVPLRLSALLEQGRAMEMELSELAVVGVTLLHSYHARSDLLGLHVARDGRLLDDPDFMGDDLLISRAEEDTPLDQSLEQTHVGRS